MNYPDHPRHPDAIDRSADVPPPLPDEVVAQSPGEQVRDILSSVGGQFDQLRRIQTDLDQQLRAVQEREQKLADDAGALEAERSAFAQERESVETHNVGLTEERERWAEETRTARAAQEEETARLEEREHELDELREKLEQNANAARERLAALTADREKLDAERDRWETQRQQDDSAIREREQACATEREELATRAARLDDQPAGDDTEMASRLEAETARCAELETTMAELETRADRAESEGIDLAQEVEQERDAARQDLAGALVRIRTLEQQIADAQGGSSAETKVGSDVRFRAMQQKITKLEAQLAEKPGATLEPQTDTSQIDDIRRKAKRLARVAEHLRRRHYRLRMMRDLLQQQKPRQFQAPDPARAAAAGDQYAARIRQVEQQRLDLGELATQLKKAENRMVRRWARTRAIVLVGWIVFLGVISAGASWLAASQIKPPVIGATVKIDARSRDRTALTDAQSEAWRIWHANIVTEPAFLETLAKRMDERRIDEYADSAALKTRLEQDLTVGVVADDRLLYTLAGTDLDQTVAVLELLGSTVAAESTRLIRKRTGEAWATLGSSTDGRYARPLNSPIADERLQWAAGLFGGIFLTILALVSFVCGRLAKVKREFDADGTLFTDMKVTGDGVTQNIAVM